MSKVNNIHYFSVANMDLRLQFNRMVEDVCDHAPLDR